MKVYILIFDVYVLIILNQNSLSHLPQDQCLPYFLSSPTFISSFFDILLFFENVIHVYMYFGHVLTPFSNFLRPSSTHPLYQLHVLLIFNNSLSPITAYHKCMGKLLVMATHPKKNNSLPPQPIAPHPDHRITCSSHVHYHLLFHLLPLKIIYLFQLALFACTWV